jgi:membrane protease YdiL (CAAX protease family)
VPVALQSAALEELLFRGLLPAALARGRSRTAPTRALLPLFGLGHLYQGLHRVVVTTAIGLLLAEVARAGRSIRPAIVLHAALDLQLLWLRDHPLRPAASERAAKTRKAVSQ